MQSLRWLIELVRQAGGWRLIVNGSFVTDRYAPNDIDCVVLIDHRYPLDANAEMTLNEGLPFLECQLLYEPDFDVMVNEVFGTDRRSVPKGVVEVIGWQ